MRWKFPKYQSPSEKIQREDVIKHIDAWWLSFAQVADQIQASFDGLTESSIDLPEFMKQTLQQIDKRIMWEFGPAIETSGHRLVITPEVCHELRPMINTLLERAPQLPSWEFYPYRLTESAARSEATVQSRTSSSLAKTMVRVVGDKFNLISLTYVDPGYKGSDDADAAQAAFVATESILGEERLDKWVGYIDVEKLIHKRFLRRSTDTRGLISLDRLRPTVEALIDARRQQLPDQSLFHFKLNEEDVDLSGSIFQWYLVKMDPPEQEDYPQQTDMYVAINCWQDCWMSILTSQSFTSERFSRHGEIFCYLKTDGREGFDENPWADRNGLQDELDAALREKFCGCVWGGGTGRMYSYIEFALTDIHQALEIIRDIIQRGKIHPRTWVLFHDSYLQHEWVGAYDHTPPPPQET